MNILDDPKQMKKFKSLAVLESIRSLADQCQQVYDETKKIKFPKNYRQIQNILVNGMGGSALGAHIFKSVYKDEIKVPFEFINSYQLPKYVNNKTLYLASSYSGNTEEPVSTLNDARKRKVKLVGLTAGGKLKNFLNKYNIPGYIFKPHFNPSGQPRLGLGYSIMGQLIIFSKLGIIKFSSDNFREVISTIERAQNKFDFNLDFNRNNTKKLAKKLQGKIPIIVAAEHLAGNAHVLANQINETAKNLSFYYLIPEFNHHLLEGLVEPKTNKSNLIFLFFESELYLSKNRKRIKITKQVLKKNKISYLSFTAREKTKLSQAFEVLSFGSYLSLYFSVLNKVNPEFIPFVDFFKKQLARK